MEIHVGIGDLLLIYLLPPILLTIVFFVFLIALYFFVSTDWFEFDFKYDLRYLFDAQKNLKRFRTKSVKFMRFYFKTMLGDNGTQALFLYRVSRFFHVRGFRLMADGIHRLSKFLTMIDLSPYAEIGRGLQIYHGSGVVIGKNTKLGQNCLVCQGVTTGSGAPQIGNNVKLWSGAKIMGNIEIGDNSEVGANAVLLKSLEANSIAVGVPADRIIKKPVQVDHA